jgi:hypothetical protein
MTDEGWDWEPAPDMGREGISAPMNNQPPRNNPSLKTVAESAFMETNTQALLERARKLCEPPTDYRLAKTVGLSHTTISNCRLHGGTLDNAGTFRLAKFLGQNFQDVLALIELDRAKTEKQRAFWESVAPRILPSLVIGLLAAGLATKAYATHRKTNGEGAGAEIGESAMRPNIHYAK